MLSSHEKLSILLGDAGSGKSTILRRLAYDTVVEGLKSDRHEHIPILLKAAELALNEDRLVDLAAATTAALSADSRTVCFTPEDLKQGKVIVLIDGLDEVADDLSRLTVLNKVRDFHEEFRLCPVILTSRKHAYSTEQGILKRAVCYEISPFNSSQAEKLVSYLFKRKSASPESVQEILRRLKDVYGVELNPLIVTLFVAVSGVNSKDIPANITELFNKYTELMLGRWDVVKGFGQLYQFPLKDHLLKIVAHYMQTEKLVRISLSKVRRLIEDELIATGHNADMEILFSEIVERSGLVRQFGIDIEFRHFMLQEYFAGRALTVPTVEFIVDRWWSNSIIFYFGDKPSAHSEVTAIIRSLANERSGRKLYQAAITIGQSLQACYMSKVPDKLVSLKWVIDTLVQVAEVVLTDMRRWYPGELLTFITYFVMARNAVALAQSDKFYMEVIVQNFADENTKDLTLFWAIIASIGSGHLAIVYDMIKSYRPSNVI
jgi:hypothetical protein